MLGCMNEGLALRSQECPGYMRHFPQLPAARYWDAPGGGRIAWSEFGDPGGRALLYYHGWPSSRWQGVLLHHLAVERGFRVLALDRPGIGDSQWVAGRRLLDWVPLISAFADAQGLGRFAQLGVSGGAPYVLACAAGIPERLVASAVLCGAVPLSVVGMKGLHPIYRALALIRKLPSACFSPPLAIAGHIAGMDPGKPPLRWILKTLAAADRELLAVCPEAMHVLSESFRHGVRQGGRGVMDDAGIYVSDWGIDLAAVRHRIHYWHGAEDRNIPASLASVFVDMVAGAELEVVAGEGHFSLAIHKAPAALDWLAAAF